MTIRNSNIEILNRLNVQIRNPKQICLKFCFSIRAFLTLVHYNDAPRGIFWFLYFGLWFHGLGNLIIWIWSEFL